VSGGKKKEYWRGKKALEIETDPQIAAHPKMLKNGKVLVFAIKGAKGLTQRCSSGNIPGLGS